MSYRAILRPCIRVVFLASIIACGSSDASMMDVQDSATVDDQVVALDAADAADDANSIDATAPGDGGTSGLDPWGGFTTLGFAAHRTGFFHVEHPAGSHRTWLVDPGGNPFWLVGVNSVLQTEDTPGIQAYLTRMPSFRDVASAEWVRLSGLGFNTVGAFSQTNAVDATMLNPIFQFAPYGLVLNPSPPSTADYVLRDASGAVIGSDEAHPNAIGDPFNPAFAAYLQSQWSGVVQPTDPNLVLYWLGNEIHVFERPLAPAGERDYRLAIWSNCPSTSSFNTPQCAPDALGRLLADKYVTTQALNAAWGTSVHSFHEAVGDRPIPRSTDPAHACTGACPDDLQVFAQSMLRRWVEVETSTLRHLDPNHLVSSPRLAVSSSDSFCWWGTAHCPAQFTDGTPIPADTATVHYSPWPLFARVDDKGFDLVSVNAYSRRNTEGYDQPWWNEGLAKVETESGLPMLVSEFGIRTQVPGWLNNSSGAPSYVAPTGSVDGDQARRGDYYAFDLSLFASDPHVLGALFHRWSDEYNATTQAELGVVEPDGGVWEPFATRIQSYNAGIVSQLQTLTGL
jgi:hypothetical protein